MAPGKMCKVCCKQMHMHNTVTLRHGICKMNWKMRLNYRQWCCAVLGARAQPSNVQGAFTASMSHRSIVLFERPCPAHRRPARFLCLRDNVSRQPIIKRIQSTACLAIKMLPQDIAVIARGQSRLLACKADVLCLTSPVTRISRLPSDQKHACR